MKQLPAALLCALILTCPAFAPAFAETALPRLSPMATVDGEGLPTGETVTLPFGQPLEVLDRDGPVVTVQDADGATYAVAAADLILPAAGQAGLVAVAEPGRETGDRPDLPLWDSAARARLYLQGGGADSLRPALTEQPGGVFPVTGLPVFAVESAPTTIGHPVLMAGAWVPVLPEALDPTGTGIGTAKTVRLHVLVDGSDYARDFTLEALQQLSRSLGQGDRITAFSRQVIFDNGTARDDGDVPAAGLRAEWPTAEGGRAGRLTDALADALDNVADGLETGGDTAHVVLVLVGPGLSAEPDALARITAAGQRLAALQAGGVDLRGVVLAQGTPEPNPANDAVLAQMAGGAATRFLDFGGDVLGGVDTVLSTAPAGDAAALAARRDRLCALARTRALPCVIAAPGVLPPVAAADWVALPLWFVLDGAALDLLPAGMDPAEARAGQDAIRACHAAGQVWDTAEAVCDATATPLPADPDGLRADLTALQGVLASRERERDAALDDLARQTAEWEEERATLSAAADEARADIAAMQLDLDSRAETIATQEDQLAAQTATIADLTDRAEALALSASDLQAQVSEAEAEVARLGEEVASRDAALLSAADQLATVTGARDAALADLARTQADLAAMQADRDVLAQDLGAAKLAQAAAEAALVQERADWQARSDAAAQALAAMTTARDQAAAQVAELTAAQDALVAVQADLAAQLDAQTTARTAAEAALQTAQDAAAQAASDAETAAKTAKAQLLAAQADYGVLVAERDDLAARLTTQTARADDLEALKADLSLAEDEVRSKHATALRTLSETEAKLTTAEAARAAAEADAAQARDALSTARTEAAAITAQLAALQAEHQALVAQTDAAQAEAVATVQGLSQRLALAEAEVSRLTAAAAQPVAEDLTVPVDAVAGAVNPSLRPKARPGAELLAAAAAPAPAKSAKAPAKTAAKAAPKVAPSVAAVTQVQQPAPSRRVAPASSAPQLKGCQFQWVGKEGRLVCP